MIGPISSSLFGSSPFGASRAPAAVPRPAFGPDFLVNFLLLTQPALGAAYDSGGRPSVPDATSPMGRHRTDMLATIRQSLQSGDFATAQDMAESLMQKYPGDAVAAYYMGRAELTRGDLPSAERTLQRAVSLSGGDERMAQDLHAVQALARGETEAVASVRRLLANNSTAREGVRLAGYLLDLHPDNVDARVALADFYERLGKHNLAGAQLGDALDHATVEQQGDLLPRLESFAARHGDLAGAHDLLARAYAAAGRLEDAERQFNTALTLAGDNVDVQKEIKASFALVYRHKGEGFAARGDELQARLAFERSLEYDRNDATLSALSHLEFDAADRSLRVGNLQTALKHFDLSRANLPTTKAEDLIRDLIARYETLAGKLTTAGDLKHTVDARNGAYLLDPKNDTRKRAYADSADAFGQSLLSLGDYYGAIKYFRMAIHVYSDDAGYNGHLAVALGHV